MRVTGHSRIPIHEGDLDNIVGLIHVKDLMTDEIDRDAPLPPERLRSPWSSRRPPAAISPR